MQVSANTELSPADLRPFTELDEGLNHLYTLKKNEKQKQKQLLLRCRTQRYPAMTSLLSSTESILVPGSIIAESSHRTVLLWGFGI